MAPPIDDTKLSPEQRELYYLLREAETFPLANGVEEERKLLAPYLSQPKMIDAYEPLQVARDNLRAALEMGGLMPEAREDPANWRRLFFSLEGKTVWEGGRPLRKTQLCDDCTFGTATTLTEGLDPRNMKTTVDKLIFQNLFKGLLEPNGRRPYGFGLAQGYHVSEDGRSYTICLREGMRWSDGKEITAHDVVFAARYHLTPANGSVIAGSLEGIENAMGYLKGNLHDFDRVGIHALDDYTVAIRLAHPSALFPHILASPALTPLPQHAIAQHDRSWTDPAHIVVSGAYTVSEYKYRNELTLRANPYYFRAGEVQYAGVVFYHSESAATALDWFRMGKIQYAPQIPLAQVAEAREMPAFHSEDKLCLYMYVMNAGRLNTTQRRALAMGFDRLRLVKHILRLGQSAAYQFVPPSLWKFMGEEPLSDTATYFNEEEAEDLLREDPLFRFGKLRVIYDSSGDHRTIAEYFQDQVKRTFRISVEIHNMETSTMLAMAKNEKDFDLMRLGWCADYPDPYDFLRIFTTGDENNYGNYQNPLFDGVVHAIEVEQDPGRRRELIRQAELILKDNPPAIPFYFYVNAYLLAPQIKGLEMDPTGGFLFERLR